MSLCTTQPLLSPNCNRVTDLAPSSIGSTTITIAWSNVTVPLYKIYIGTNLIAFENEYETTATFYQLINLLPNTTYYIRVASVCSENDISESAIISVTTNS